MPLLLRLTALAMPALLAACSGGSPEPELGFPSGTTLQSVQGAPSGATPLRPETGNIWGEGLQPTAPRP